MKPKIVLYGSMAKDLVERLERHCTVLKLSKKDPDFLQEVQTAEGIIGSGLKVDQQFLDQAPSLRIVSNMSAGYDNLDVGALTNRGIMATNIRDVLTDTTADTIFGLLMVTARKLSELDSYVKSGKWTSRITEEQYGIDVHHKILGVIGMGRIGQAIAERAHYGFKMDILYHNRSQKLSMEKELDAEFTDLDDLLKRSDFVCLMAPLTPETVHLIGRREFGLMKKTGIFINGSRGALVNEDDLIQALKNKEIHAAGLDVYDKEPLNPKSPLLQLKNVVTLPHIGSATNETRYKMAELAVENLIKGINNEKPPCLINTEVF